MFFSKNDVRDAASDPGAGCDSASGDTTGDNNGSSS